MKILIQENLKTSLKLNEIKNTFKEYNIPINILYCQIQDKCTVDEITDWIRKKFHEKTLIMSDKKIIGQKPSNEVTIKFKGFSNTIGGDLAIVKFNNKNPTESIMISLHEALHLHGLRHCHSLGCIMSLKLCKLELKYCLLCKEKCNKLYLCNECKEALYGK